MCIVTEKDAFEKKRKDCIKVKFDWRLRKCAELLCNIYDSIWQLMPNNFIIDV